MIEPIEIKGKYNIAKVYANEIELPAVGQLKAMVDSPQFEKCNIAVMPDVCPGKGSVVGLTIRHPENIMFPALLGTDLYCGIKSVMVKSKTKPDLNKLDKFIRQNIPAGMGQLRSKPHRLSEALDPYRKDLNANVNFDKEKLGIGTLGGGNHFIELGKDGHNNYYLTVHTGSRGFGAKISEYWCGIADSLMKEKELDVSHYLAYLYGEDNINRYLDDIQTAEAFANINTDAILEDICKEMGFKVQQTIYSKHNYYNRVFEGYILRKGAIFCGNPGAYVIVGLNMRDGLLLVIPGSNDNKIYHHYKEWNYSLPHGTGRDYSRADAQLYLTVNRFKKEMEGIYSTSISKDTLDESPMAYKSTSELLEIMDELKDDEYIDGYEIIKPVYSFKAGK